MGDFCPLCKNQLVFGNDSIYCSNAKCFYIKGEKDE